MTKTEKILQAIDKYTEIDRKKQTAMDKYCMAIASGSYGPIIEETNTEAFIEAISIILPIKDELEYYAWEAKSMDDPYVIYKGKKYMANKAKEYAEYLNLIINQDDKD